MATLFRQRARRPRVTSQRPLWGGLALCASAVALVVAGALARGPLNPACAGRPYAEGCLQWLPTLLFWVALPVAIAGGILVAIWLGRRAAVDDQIE